MKTIEISNCVFEYSETNNFLEEEYFGRHKHIIENRVDDHGDFVEFGIYKGHLSLMLKRNDIVRNIYYLVDEVINKEDVDLFKYNAKRNALSYTVINKLNEVKDSCVLFAFLDNMTIDSFVLFDLKFTNKIFVTLDFALLHASYDPLFFLIEELKERDFQLNISACQFTTYVFDRIDN